MSSPFGALERGARLRGYPGSALLRLVGLRLVELALWSGALLVGHTELIASALAFSGFSLAFGATAPRASSLSTAIRVGFAAVLRGMLSLSLAFGPMLCASTSAFYATPETRVRLFLLALPATLVSVPFALWFSARTGTVSSLALRGAGPVASLRQAWRSTRSALGLVVTTQSILLVAELVLAGAATTGLGVWEREALLSAELVTILNSEGWAFVTWRLISVPVAIWASLAWDEVRAEVEAR